MSPLSDSIVPDKSYTNTIDYSQQAAGRTYSSFQSPLSSNLVVLFLTSFDL
jgi:hypothetical protein